ncbi:MAG: TlpA family protein disulfide reductase [Muribaculaceae bacterium]|nr:TlpA family protein disulfide reductase [Muribaculaceae bacterium]
MKFTSLFAVAAGAAILASCSGKKETVDSFFDPFDYTLTVTNIDGADSTYAYLYDYDLLTNWRDFPAEALVDSAFILNNEAKFAGKDNTTHILILRINNNNHCVLPQSGENTYDATAFAGSGVAAKAMKTYNDSLKSIYLTAQENLPAQEDPAYEAYVDSVNNLIMAFNNQTLSDNLDNAFGLYQLTTASDITLAQIDSLVAIQPDLAKSKRVQALIEGCKKFEATSAGHPYVDFEIEYKDATQKLSDYVKPGEYTLVDFWASWCGPCKRAIAGLKENYDALKAEGLNIVGVAVWEDPENTEAWLQENPLPWPLILNAQAIPTDLYSIKGIPTLLLIGPDGNILVRSYSDEEILDAFHAAIATEE